MKVLEIGAGIGTMLVRAVERGLLAGPSTYVATDCDAERFRAARTYISQWARQQGHSLSWSGALAGRLRTDDADVSVVFDPISAETLADQPDKHTFCHLLIAHAVLDLIDFPSLLPKLLPKLKDSGLALLTCNFDGETLFLPECDYDEEIIRCYHGSMEARRTGSSRTGRGVLSFLQRSGIEILAAGSSDWVIHPCIPGYCADETHFLHAIIETVEGELGKKKNPPSGLGAWARLRHRQVEDGQLSFLARNLDLLARHRGCQ